MTAQALLFDPRAVAITDPGEDVAEIGDAREFFPTAEREILQALLLGMAEAGHEPLPLHGTIRESAAGEGALIRHLEALVPSRRVRGRPTRQWSCWEVRRRGSRLLMETLAELGLSATVYNADFLADVATGCVPRVDLELTNPPWSRMIEWAEAALKVSDVVALHGPLATVETPDRGAWLRAHMPDVYPLEWRPNYDGRGTVGRPVAWFVWGQGRGGRWWPLRKPEPQEAICTS